MICPDESVLLGVADGWLVSQERVQVLSHLDGCARCRRIVGQLARSSAKHGANSQPKNDIPRDSLAAPQRLQRGSRLGRYVVLDHLGSGGMGVVFSAYDPELERKVAVKLLHANPNREYTSEAGARLSREAKAMARLSHPNVITVHDVGLWDEQVFIAMEFVDGCSLRQWLTEQPRSWRAVRDMFLQAGRGLAAAHSAGLIHRDFKPDNVLVRADGAVRVTDFGLARQTGDVVVDPAVWGLVSEPCNDLSLTRTGEMVGTPRYMAPELFEGKPADARTDQFSYCVALYEAWFREPPFVGTSLRELQESVRAGRRRHPKKALVPHPLVLALERGLSRDPKDRFGSMNELLNELSRDPITLRRRWLAATASVMILGLSALGYHVLQDDQHKRCSVAARELAGVWDVERQHAVQKAFQASGREYALDSFQATQRALSTYVETWASMRDALCIQMLYAHNPIPKKLTARSACLEDRFVEIKALADLLATPDGLVVENAPMAVGGLTNLRACAEHETHNATPTSDPAPETVERVFRDVTGARTLVLAGRYEKAVEHARTLVEQARELQHPALLAETLLVFGDAELGAGRHKDGVRALQQAVLAAESAGDDQRAARALLLLIWSATSSRMAVNDTLMGWVQHAQAKIARLGAANLELQGELEYLLARVAYDCEDHSAKALPHAQKALATLEPLLGRFHPKVINARGLLGFLMLELGQTHEAIGLLQATVDDGVKGLGPAHPRLALKIRDLAEAYNRAHDMEKALELTERALAIQERVLPPNHPHIAQTLAFAADFEAALGHPEKALEKHRRALPVLRQRYGAESQYVAEVMVGMCGALIATGKPEEALQITEQLETIQSIQRGVDHPLVGAVLLQHGLALLALGKAKQATSVLEKAVRLLERREFQDVVDLRADAHFGLAQALGNVGQEAERAYALALAARHFRLSLRQSNTNVIKIAEIDRWLAQHPPRGRR